jgi:hypothetical protein
VVVVAATLAAAVVAPAEAVAEVGAADIPRPRTSRRSDPRHSAQPRRTYRRHNVSHNRAGKPRQSIAPNASKNITNSVPYSGNSAPSNTSSGRCIRRNRR